MANKYVRGLTFSTGSTVARVSYFLKMMYEFWGFCVFGGSSLSSPGTGAFASTTPTGGGLPGNFLGTATTIAAGSNGVSLPQATINVASTTGFPTNGTIYVYTSNGTQAVTYTGVTATTFTGCTGGTGSMSTGNNVTSSSLMTIGSDGYTNATTEFRVDGYTEFFANSTTPFTPNMVGKQLVMWKANSGSSEDSIYNIIFYKSPNNIIINVNSGGTPASASDGYKPSVTTRSSINYRVIDVGVAGSSTGIADGNFMVFQLDPTGINTGQANPQIQVLQANSGQRIDYRMSPNGSWTGTAFGADASAVLPPNTVSSSGTNSNQLQNTASSGTLSITLIGDKSFMIGWGKDSAHSSSSGFHWHWEIPERIYSQTQDPNPFAVSMNAYRSASQTQIGSDQTFNGYGGGFVMRCNDGVYRNHRTLVRSLIGDGAPNLFASTVSAVMNVPGNNLTDIRGGANPQIGMLFNSYGVLSLPRVVGQYSLARVRLRNVRFANTFMQLFTRFSSNGDFLLLTQGVAVPWDKTVIPFTLFPF